MLTSALAVVAVLALILLAFGALNPLLLGAVLVLALVPLTLRLLVGVFGRSASQTTSTGPRVPSTSEAAYDPVERPS